MLFLFLRGGVEIEAVVVFIRGDDALGNLGVPEGIENSREALVQGGVNALRKGMNNGTILPAIGMPILGSIAAKLYSEGEVSASPGGA